MLNLGQKAPNPKVETHLGYKGELRHFWKDGPLVLFFYPKDNTRICTKQACIMQTSFAEFSQLEANVVGVSTDNLDSHRRFADKHGLDFPLIADAKGSLSRAYDAYRRWIGICKRITYIIDSNGRIKGRLHSELSVGEHLDMIRRALAH